MERSVIGLFADLSTIEKVIAEINAIGIDSGDMSLVANNEKEGLGHHIHLPEALPINDLVPPKEGAIFGAAMGGLAGILLSLGTIPIGGIGGLVVAGPLLAGLTGALAGAATGGLVAGLMKTGVPEPEAQFYAEGVKQGGLLLIVHTDDNLAQQVDNLMLKYGAIEIDERALE
jgi:hypothetical protein